VFKQLVSSKGINVSDGSDLRTLQVEDKIVGWKNDKAERKFLFDGELNVMKVGSTEPVSKYIFVFNDICLITKKIKGKSAKSKKPFQYQQTINLSSTLIQNIDDDEALQHAFSVVAMDTKKKFIFIATNPIEKSQWFNLFSGKMDEFLGDSSPTPASPIHKRLQTNDRQDSLKGITALERVHSKAKMKKYKQKIVLKEAGVKNKEDDDEGTDREVIEGFEQPPWDPDSCTNECTACGVKFSTTNRRHHCRNCGHIYCNKCTSKSCHLPRFGLTKKKVRVCERCFLSH